MAMFYIISVKCYFVGFGHAGHRSVHLVAGAPSKGAPSDVIVRSTANYVETHNLQKTCSLQFVGDLLSGVGFGLILRCRTQF